MFISLRSNVIHLRHNHGFGCDHENSKRLRHRKLLLKTDPNASVVLSVAKLDFQEGYLDKQTGKTRKPSTVYVKPHRTR